MSSDTKAMEEALQAAVAKMNRNGTNGATPAPPPTDPLSLLMAILPKLLENREPREDIAEKLEGLQSEELAPLREQVRLVRVQLHRMRKVQEETFDAIQRMQEQQSAVGEAVLHLARQLSRLEFLDADAPDEDCVDEELYERPQRPVAPRRAAATSKTSTRTKNSRHERP